MAKGYLMANLRVKDQDIFKEFSSVALPLIESFGGKLLARGPHADRHEGSVSVLSHLLNLKVKKPLKNFILVTNIKLQNLYGTRVLIPTL